MQFDLLFHLLQENRSEEDSRRIRSAYDFAAEIHKDQMRDSGELFIHHPVRVTEMLFEHEYTDTEEMILALIHDVKEKGDVTEQDIVSRFGTAAWEGLELLSNVVIVRDANSGEVIRRKRKPVGKFFGAIENSYPRVIRVKLADRLHNLQTLAPWDRKRKLAYVAETRKYLLKPFAREASVSLAEDVLERCIQVKALLTRQERSA
jgi:GTP diphosphokinase / guanosine-3',5'-bis(diphosphate) 3'-diphosphatase